MGQREALVLSTQSTTRYPRNAKRWLSGLNASKLLYRDSQVLGLSLSHSDGQRSCPGPHRRQALPRRAPEGGGCLATLGLLFPRLRRRLAIWRIVDQISCSSIYQVVFIDFHEFPTGFKRKEDYAALGDLVEQLLGEALQCINRHCLAVARFQTTNCGLPGMRS